MPRLVWITAMLLFLKYSTVVGLRFVFISIFFGFLRCRLTTGEAILIHTTNHLYYGEKTLLQFAINASLSAERFSRICAQNSVRNYTSIMDLKQYCFLYRHFLNCWVVRMSLVLLFLALEARSSFNHFNTVGLHAHFFQWNFFFCLQTSGISFHRFPGKNFSLPNPCLQFFYRLGPFCCIFCSLPICVPI